MRHLIAASLLFLTILCAGGARADFDQSKAWFEALTPDERSETQANLTLLGFYTFLVDGQFGNGTFQALTDFQRSRGRAVTGVLIPRDSDALQQMAAKVYADLGMDLVRDKEGQSALILPVGLLTVTKATKRGNSYAMPDDGIALETIRRPANEQSFAALFEELKTPGNGRFITYSNYNESRFVVSGKENGRQFYTMFQNAETDSIGYSLSWTEANNERASMLSIFIASYFQPLRYMPPEQQEVKITETPTVAQTFGVFSLPAGRPDVIMLNGEVTHTLYSDFTRAYAARPGAHVIVLNSPGGYVDNALQVARIVHDKQMGTVVPKGMGCYSACSYIFFAGAQRTVEGELGVHQISAEVADLVMAQTTLGDVLDALNQYGVEQQVISVMLKTPPKDMYIFTLREIADLGISAGDPIVVADIGGLTAPGIPSNAPANDDLLTPAKTEPTVAPTPGGTAYVQLSSQNSPSEADRSLQFAKERWAGVLKGAEPEIEQVEGTGGTRYRVRVPTRSLEAANALCAAIKSNGGGCYVTQS